MIEKCGNLINDYKDNTTLVVCAGLTANNETTTTIRWALDTLDGTRIYTSLPQITGFRFMQDLTKLGLEDWTMFTLSALFSDGSKVTSDITLQYYSGTRHVANFDLVENNGDFNIEYY